MLRNLTRLLRKTTLNRRISTLKHRRDETKYGKYENSLNSRTDRSLHLNCSKYVKQFVERENNHALKIIQNIPLFVSLQDAKTPIVKVISTEEDFNTFLDRNWRSATPSDVVEGFLNVTDFCAANNINISDQRFDKLVDGLMDTVDKMSHDELYAILNSLTRLPETEGYDSHNFHDVWSALDDICCIKSMKWDRETLYKFANVFHRLHLARIGDYVFTFLNKISRKPSKLTREQLVHAFFYMNVCRKRPVDFEYAAAVQTHLKDFTVDEMAIIAMGFFKSQTNVKLAPVLNRMLELVIENAETIHEISLAAILKIVRLSRINQTRDNLLKMLDRITPEIPRLSHLCATHAALVGTGVVVFHEPILKAVAQKTVDNISNIETVRLKDIERVLCATTMYDYDPETSPDFYQTLSDELHREERLPEKMLHPKSLPITLWFFSIRNVYPEKLLGEILNPAFTIETYGKNPRKFPRDIFSLALSVDIECPNYIGPTWDPEMRMKACKWLVESLPEPDRKLSAADKLTYDVINILTKVTGDKKYLYVGHILPHFLKSDVVVCLDKETNQFVDPTVLDDYQLHEIKYPKDLDRFKWFCLVMASLNVIIRNTFKPVGMLNMKQRQLRIIGYEPIVIQWNEYEWLQEDDKVDYILNKMKRL